MKVGKVMRNVKIPEKINRGIEAKYPVVDMVVGSSFFVAREKGDPDLKTMKRRIIGSMRQVERRLGKTATGKKVKEFAVWTDGKNDGVFVGLREDNSGEKKAAVVKTAKKVNDTPAVPAPVQAKLTPVKKSVPPMKKKAAPVKTTPAVDAVTYSKPPARPVSFDPKAE